MKISVDEYNYALEVSKEAGMIETVQDPNLVILTVCEAEELAEYISIQNKFIDIATKLSQEFVELVWSKVNNG